MNPVFSLVRFDLQVSFEILPKLFTDSLDIIEPIEVPIAGIYSSQDGSCGFLDFSDFVGYCFLRSEVCVQEYDASANLIAGGVPESFS